jgi:general secretion pathway protein D
MNKLLLAAASVLALAATGVDAQPSDASEPPPPHALDVYALIDRIAEETGREVVYSDRLPTINSTERDASDYETLQAVLRTIGFMTVETGNQILIMPENVARSSPTRVLQDDDRRISDHEFVTRVITVPSIEIQTSDGVQTVDGAPQLVPILRPMLGNSAQLGAAQGTGKLIIVDRYDNVRRITEVIEELVNDR